MSSDFLRASAPALPTVHRPTALRGIGDIVNRSQVRQPRLENRCAMVIDGEAVWVDIENYDVMPGQRAVVIEHNGQIRLQVVDPIQNDFKPLGVRSALGERRPSLHGGTVRNTVAVVGVVIEPYQAGITIEGQPARSF